MFRLQDNLPEVYINESRDFQILARISDMLFSSIKYDVDTMVNILDATLVKDKLLDLLCTRVGFFPAIEIDAQVLKYIIASFPYIIKHKGTAAGIKAAVNAVLKAENTQAVQTDAVGGVEALDNTLVEIISKKPKNETRNEYTVYIYTTQTIYNKDALAEIFKYVLPAGFTYKLFLIGAKTANRDNAVIVQTSDAINVLRTTIKRAGSVRNSNDENIFIPGSMADRVIGAFDTTTIVSSNAHLIDSTDIDKVECIINNNEQVESST